MGEKGSTIVEFAFVALLFFTLIFGIVDLAVLLYVNLTMQHAVREGTRYAVTGQSTPGTDRRTALIQKIKANSYGLYEKNLNPQKDPEIAVLNPSEVTATNYTGTVLATGDPGGRDDVIVVSLTYTWPLLTPLLKPFFTNGKYTFTVKSTMKNEPF